MKLAQGNIKIHLKWYYLKDHTTYITYTLISTSTENHVEIHAAKINIFLNVLTKIKKNLKGIQHIRINKNTLKMLSFIFQTEFWIAFFKIKNTQQNYSDNLFSIYFLLHEKKHATSIKFNISILIVFVFLMYLMCNCWIID